MELQVVVGKEVASSMARNEGANAQNEWKTVESRKSKK